MKKEKTNKQLVQDDIGNASALEAVKNSEGGKILLTSLQKDILLSIDMLTSKFPTASHIELIANCAKLNEKLALFRAISRSSKNKKLAMNELDAILAESEE
jgi:hypothetical protein